MDIEFFKHLARVIDWCHGPVVIGVTHAGPRIRAIRYRDTELQRTEACPRFVARLKEIADLLVDRDTAGPAGGRV